MLRFRCALREIDYGPQLEEKLRVARAFTARLREIARVVEWQIGASHVAPPRSHARLAPSELRMLRSDGAAAERLLKEFEADRARAATARELRWARSQLEAARGPHA
jgi:hypothetical protein